MKIDNGGPAFPVHPDMAGQLGCVPSQSDAGMTLRDYFAGQALYSASFYEDGCPVFAEEVAARAYEVADAMLAQRRQK